MLDHLDVAQRRYQTLRTAPAVPTSPNRVKQLSLWLEHDVCRIVDELSQRSTFRDLCRWPLTHLASGAESPERRLADTIDETLVAWASGLAKAGRGITRWQRMRRLNRSAKQSGTNHRAHLADKGSADASFAAALAGIDYVARRPWRDLVAIADYFSPTAELNLVDRGAYLGQGNQHIQIADFLAACNPALRRLGDFVSRSLLIRIAYWRDMLERFAALCRDVALRLDFPGDGVWKGAQETRAQLVAAHEALQGACTGRGPILRNSCTALLQVYVAYRPAVKLPWLGLPRSIGQRPYWLRHRLENHRDTDIADCAADALLDVAPIYRDALDVEGIVAEHVQARDLVLVMGPGCREVHWRGQLIQANWFVHRALWGLLVALAQAAKNQLGVDAFDDPSRSYKDARHRLKPLIPEALNALILPAGRGTYRLDLAANAICLLEFDSQQRLVESGTS
jgi:hypothetical protein